LNFPYSTYLVKNLVDKDPNLDFMDPDRREKLSELNLSDQIGLKLNQQLQKICQIAQQKWSNYMKKNFEF
jgi:hypothetical protein